MQKMLNKKLNKLEIKQQMLEQEFQLLLLFQMKLPDYQ
jgi:hypothetical protein